MPSAPIKTIGVIAKPRSELATSLVPELIAWLEQRKIAVAEDHFFKNGLPT